MKLGAFKKVLSMKSNMGNMEFVSYKCFLLFLCLGSCFHESLADKSKETFLTVLNKCTFSPDSDESASAFSPGDRNEFYEKWKFNTTISDFQEITFNLKSFQPQCSGEETSIEVTFMTDEHDMDENTALFKNLTTQGELIWKDRNGYLHSSMPHSFCVNINSNKTNGLSFMTCKSGCTVHQPCVRKCCHPNEILDVDSRTCKLSTKRWTPFFYSAVNHKADEPLNYSITYGIPTCPHKYVFHLLPSSKMNYKGDMKLNLLLNGSLVEITKVSTVLNQDEFCIDGHPYHTKDSSGDFTKYSGSEWDQVAIICAPEQPVLNKCFDSSEEENNYSSEFPPDEYLGNWKFKSSITDMSQDVYFNLKNFQTQCVNGDTAVQVGFTAGDSKIDSSQGLLQNISATGELIWKDSDGYLHSSLPHSYCIKNPNNKTKEVSFMTCKSGCTVDRPCVRKCCHPNQIVDPNSRTCNLTTKNWKPFFYSALNNKADEPESYSIKYGFPSCKLKYVIQLFQSTTENNKGNIMKLNLLLNGSLLQINGDSSVTVVNSGQFCIDGYPYYTIDGKPSENRLANYSGSEWDQVAIICAPEDLLIPSNVTDPDAPCATLLKCLQSVRYIVTAVLLTISAICLLLMDIVYLILWKYKNVHEWLQFSCATSFLVAFTALAIAQTFSIQIYNANPQVCKILGIVIYFSFLCAFFWMTSINADLWYRFNGCRPLRTRSRPAGDGKKFFFFALFSLGVPFVIASCAVTLDYIYMSNPNDSPIPTPGFGQEHCYFKARMVELPYAKGPQAVLFVFNIIFFFSTALYLRHYHKDTELARTNSNSDDKKSNFRLLAKLFIVMGILWIFELISWGAGVMYPDNEILTLLIFFPADVLNALQGVAIFIIYVCKPNTINQLKATINRKPSVKSIKNFPGPV